MCKFLQRCIVLALLTPVVSLATVNVSPSWDSVEFTAGNLRVEAKSVWPRYELSDFRVWVSGKAVNIPVSEFNHITHAELEKIRVVEVTGSSGSAYVEIPFLVKESESISAMKPGGAWIFQIEGGKFTHKELDPAPSP